MLVDETRGLPYPEVGHTWATKRGVSEDTHSFSRAGIPSGTLLTVKFIDPEAASAR